MKRGSFLKLVATMVVAPTLMGDIEIKATKSETDESSFDGDRIRIFTKDIDKCRLNDMIVSDLGDAAIIISISRLSSPYIEAKPIQYGRYKYQSLNNFRVMYRACAEV